MSGQPSSEVPPTASVLALMLGVAQTQLLRVATQLGLADRLKAGPQSVTTLAEATQTNLPALLRILRALTHLGILVETAPQEFACSPSGALLQTDHPASLYGMALLFGSPYHFQSWLQLPHSVQTGTSAFEHVFGMPLYAYLQHHPEEAAMFYEAMTAVSKQESQALLEVYDFAPYQTVVDVGGGRGLLLATLLQHYPTLHGVLFDLPHVADTAHAVLHAFSAAGRCQILGGDFLTTVPAGGHVYLLKRVIVDRDDAQAHTVLRHIRHAIHPQGRVLIADPDPTSLYGMLFDIRMLVTHGSESRLRTDDDMRVLLTETGFTLRRTMVTPSTLRLYEGAPT